MKEKIDLIFSDLKNECITEKQAHRKILDLFSVSGNANDFEIDLYNLINAYVSSGLNKSDLVDKMEYITNSCRVS